MYSFSVRLLARKNRKFAGPVPCVDIYGRHRYIDFALESPESKIAIEIMVRPTTTLARCPKINMLMTS